MNETMLPILSQHPRNTCRQAIYEPHCQTALGGYLDCRSGVHTRPIFPQVHFTGPYVKFIAASRERSHHF